MLCQNLPNVEYFDCELPRIRQVLEDPESFLELTRGKSIVLDEVHRLHNPSELLKIAADHFPETKVIATGSSTLEASSKFRDTLTGRRERIWLTPMLIQEGEIFGDANLEHRFLFGGLPPFFLNAQVPERDFQDWIDSYWAKDIQELYRLEKRYSFQKFLELTLAQSGSSFDPTNLKKFRQYYPEGNNFVVASDVNMTYKRNYGEVNVSFVGLSQLIETVYEANTVE